MFNLLLYCTQFMYCTVSEVTHCFERSVTLASRPLMHKQATITKISGTRLWPWTTTVQFPKGAEKRLLLLHRVQTGPPSLLFNGYRGLFPGGGG